MNMVCCGQVVDTIRCQNNKYELMVEWNPPSGYIPRSEELKVGEFYLPIKFCPFCGQTLEYAHAFYVARQEGIPIEIKDLNCDCSDCVPR